MGIIDRMVANYVAPERAAMEAPGRTADAWNSVMQQMKSNPQVQGALQGQKQDPLGRWKQQLDLMIGSGDPTLQKNAMSMLSQYQGRATSPPPVKKQSAAALMADEQGLTGQEKIDFIAGQANKRSYAQARATASDAKSLIYPDKSPVIAGTPMQEVYERGAIPRAGTTEPSQFGKLQNINSSIAELDDIFNRDDLDFDLDNQLSGMVADFRTGGGPVANVADFLLNQSGRRLTPDEATYISNIRSINSQMLNLLSGASATDKEYDRVKSELPQLGQSKELRAANMKKTRANFKQYTAIYNKMRGAGITQSEDIVIPDSPVTSQQSSNNGQGDAVLPPGYTWK